MTDEERLERLLDQYEDQQEQTGSCDPEELCRDTPELLEPLRARIRELDALNSFLSEENSGTTIPQNAAAEGRYRAIQFRAKGGMGEVFVAIDDELNRKVALKGIQARFVRDVENCVRFVREAKITGKLEHPGIVPIYGLVRGKDGRPYYAMRLIHGETLDDAIAKFHEAERAGRTPGVRTLELQKLLRSFHRICETVAYAHSRGILHRDIKPSNIMIGPYGETLLVDWGLGKLYRRHGANESKESEPPLVEETAEQTLPGRAQGTLEYMSPEQASGSQDLGPTSDIYSLGATLYKLLTGKPAFVRRADIYEKVKTGMFLPPRQVQPNVSPALEAICLKSMRLDPRERYASASELAEEVEHWLADEPVRAYPEPKMMRARRWLQRHRALVGTSAAGVVLAIVVLAVMSGLLAGANRNLAKANHDLNDAWEGEHQAVESALTSQDQAYAAMLQAERERQRAEENERLAHEREIQAHTDQARALMVAGDFPAARRVLLEAWRMQDELKNDSAGQRVSLLRALVQGPPPLVTYPAHATRVTALAANVPGLCFASGDAAGEIRLGDLCLGRDLRRWKAHGAGSVNALLFTKNGQELWSAGSDFHVRCWDVKSGELLRGIDLSDAVNAFALSSDEQNLLVACGNGRAYLFDAHSGKQKLVLEGHEGWVSCCAFAPDASFLVTGSMDGTVRRWNPLTGKQEAILRKESSPILGVTVSDDQKYVFSCGSNASIQALDPQKGGVEYAFDAHQGGVNSLELGPGQMLLSAGNDKRVRVWHIDAQGARELGRFATLRAEAPLRVVRLVQLPGQGETGTLALTAGADGLCQLWDLKSLNGDGPLSNKCGPEDPAWNCTFSPDGRLLATGGNDTGVCIWDCATRRQLAAYTYPLPVTALDFRPDLGFCVTGSKTGEICAWDTRTQRKLWSKQAHEPKGILARAGLHGVTSVRILPDGQHALSAGVDGRVLIWKLDPKPDDAPLIGQLEPHKVEQDQPDPIFDLRLSDDGQRALAVSPNLLRVHEIEMRKTLLSIPMTNGAIRAIFMPDEKSVLVSALSTLTLERWNFDDSRRAAELHGHAQAITGLAWLQPGRLLAAGDTSGEVRFWDMAVEKSLDALPCQGPVTQVAASHDGRFLAATTKKETAQLWDFGGLSAYRALQEKFVQAQSRLAQNPLDAAALKTCADWYAQHRVWRWALDLYLAAQKAGAEVSTLERARAYFGCGQGAQAASEFKQELERTHANDGPDANAYARYLHLCLEAAEALKPQ